jgi:porin
LRPFALAGLPALVAAALPSTAVHAQTAGDQSPAPPATPTPPGASANPAPSEPGFTTQLFASSRTNLLGDMWGLRSWAGQYGVTYGLQESDEVFGNVSGGAHTGADYDGQTMTSLGIDTQKAFGWEGGIFNISAFQIHGRNLSTDNLYTLQTASGIEADRSTRLWELWFQQSFLGGQMDLKLGQQSLDQEFIISSGAANFINTMFGWPVVPSYDLYAGGPAYPLSSLGVRLRAEPTGDLTLLGGVFDDNPPGGPFYDDSQVRGAEQSGTKFYLDTGALFIAEAQYAINQPVQGQTVPAGAPPPGLPGTYKLGGWFDTASFPDQRVDTNGVSLASPLSNGESRRHHYNFSLYGVADQTVWRPNPDQPLAAGVFARIMGAPSDRNLISFALNAGVVVKAPLPGRDSDTIGIGYGLAQVGRGASLLDKDIEFYTASTIPVRSSESFIELTNIYQIAPWWSAQPDFQYVFMPGGGIANPLQPTRRVGNEAVLGLRTVVTF